MTKLMAKQNQNLHCPKCASIIIIKKGLQIDKFQTTQRYYCKSCKKIFTEKNISLKNKTYPPAIILNAISYYNIGYTQQQTSNLIAKKHKIKVPQRTISQWLDEYKNITTFNKLRKEALKLYTKEEIIEKHTFMHNNLPYTFQVHKAKLELLFKNKLYNNKFSNTKKFQKSLIDYLNKIPTSNFPTIYLRSTKRSKVPMQ